MDTQTAPNTIQLLPDHILDEESGQQYLQRSDHRNYLCEFEKLGIRFYVAEYFSGDAEVDVATLIKKFGHAVVRDLVNDRIAIGIRQKVKASRINPLISTDDNITRTSLANLAASKPYAIIFDADEADQYTPGERELTYGGWLVRLKKHMKLADAEEDTDKKRALLEQGRSIMDNVQKAMQREMDAQMLRLA